MTYKYVAYTADRRLVKGKIDADAEDLAKEALWQRGYSVVRLKAARPGLSLHEAMPSFFGVKASDVITFSRHFATLIEKGVPAFRSLQILRDQTRSAAFKEVIATVMRDLQEGSPVGDAVGRHPRAFPPIYSRMVKVGEQTGNLGSVLRQVAGYMDRQKITKRKIRIAMVYPAVIMLVAAGVVAILITFALPPLLTMFDQFGSGLPLATRALVGFADFVTAYKLQLLGAAIGGSVAAVWCLRRPSVRQRLDRLLLRMPVIGPIITGREMFHLSHTLSISLDAGLPMSETMDLAVQTTQNSAARREIEELREQVLQGRGLSATMAASRLFPPLVVQVVKVGEEAGTLSEDMMTVADLYEREVDEKVEFFLSMLQPALLLMIGLGVAFIAIAVIMPIYTMMGTIE
jgi:type IV pilus assembly protein PilC